MPIDPSRTYGRPRRRPPSLPRLSMPIPRRMAAALLTTVGIALVVGAIYLPPLDPPRPEPPAASARPGVRAAAERRAGYLSSRGGSPGRALPTTEAPPSPEAKGGEPPPTAEPPPTPTPAPEPKKATAYQVVAGDTLNALAQRYGVSAESIVWANELQPGAVLRIGQELTIPPVSGVLYRVQKGDTLLAIARKHEVSPQAIIEANGLTTPDVLSIDQELAIPGARRIPAPAPMPQAGSQEHRVVAGETVASIARRYGVEAAALVRANGLDDPDTIRVGQLLAIPGTAPTVAPPTMVAESTPPPPPPTAEQAAPAAADKGQEILAIASRYAGYRYTWGGHSPSTGFDCSGFAWFVYQQAGISIPIHDAAGQLAAGQVVARSELLPGDLVFFQNTYKAGLSHVGIYAGGGRFIHAANEGSGVRFDALDSAYWDVRYYGASRPW